REDEECTEEQSHAPHARTVLRRADGSVGRELDDQAALERGRDSHERVDPRRPPARLEAGDRRLGRADQSREIHLREPKLAAPLGNLSRDLREEPAVLGAGEPLSEALQGPFALRHRLHSISSVLYSRYEIQAERTGGRGRARLPHRNVAPELSRLGA